MNKEAIVCAVIIILIIVLNIVTQNYTKKSVEELTSSLNELKTEIIAENKEESAEILEQIKKQWNEIFNKLAYYIEHDELEKFETNLVALEGFLEVNDYNTGVSELNKSIFVLEHIAEKYTFNLVNIF